MLGPGAFLSLLFASFREPHRRLSGRNVRASRWGGGLWAEGCGLRAAGCGLRAVDCSLQSSGHDMATIANPQLLPLPAHDCGSQNSGIYWAFLPSLWQGRLLRKSFLRVWRFCVLEDGLKVSAQIGNSN